MTLRRLIVLTFALFACLAGYAVNPNDSIPVDTVLLDDGSLYIGQIQDSLFNGHGRCVYADGTIYEGEWKDGLWNGQGYVVYPDGDIYRGTFRNHLKEGKGDYIYASGARYNGEWKKDMFNGVGKLVFEDGGIYEGAWKDDMKHGYGKLVSYDGETNTGYFYYDEFLGMPYDTDIDRDSTLTDELKSWGFKHEEHISFSNLELGCSFGSKGMFTTSLLYNANDHFYYGMSIGFNIEPPTKGVPAIGMTLVNYIKDIHFTGEYISSQYLLDAGYTFLGRYSVGGSIGMGVWTAYMNCRANSPAELYDAYWINYGDSYTRRSSNRIGVAYRGFLKFKFDKEKPKALMYLGYGNADGLFLGVSFYL